MKKFLLGFLAVILILGVLGAAGFAGYRYGLNQGVLSASNDDAQQIVPGFGEIYRMPMHNFGNDGFRHPFEQRGFNRMHGGMGFGFFSPFMFLTKIAFWGLVIWAVYLLVARSGWRLVKASPTAPRVEPVPADPNAENKPSDAA